MKKQNLVRVLIYIFVILLILGITNPTLAMQNSGNGRLSNLLQTEPPPLPDISTFDGTAQFTFEQLGFDTFDLRSPFSRQLSKDFPYRWAIQGGINQSYIEIHYDMVVTKFINLSITEQNLNLPTLEVYVDDIFAGAIIPQPGLNQIARFPIPPEAVQDTSITRHRFNFIYFRGELCIDDLDSRLVIYNDSSINIKYTNLQPDLNLAEYPRPLIQDSFIPETLNLILPDNITEQDLTVAAQVAASIGNLGGSNLEINTLSSSEVTPDVLSSSSAIIIGAPDRNAFLAQLYANRAGLPSEDSLSLPTFLSPDGMIINGLNSQSTDPGDGILQLTRALDNPENTYLIVTGGNQEAIMKAARALSGATPSILLNGNLAVVSDFIETTSSGNEEKQITFSLGELGMRDTTYYGIGRRSLSVSFYVPLNWNIQNDAALYFSYIHSSQLSSSNSSFTIKLNGNSIGSAQVDPTKKGEQLVVIPIRPGDIRLGEKNRLTFDIFVYSVHDCTTLDPQSVWFRIRDTSLIHLPYEFNSQTNDSIVFSNPFFYLLSGFDSNKVWIALPPTPSESEIEGMVQLAYLMGGELLRPDYKLMVTMDDDPSPENFPEYNIVAFGQPTDNPLISLVNDQMPQPFLAGENTLQQLIGNTTYRLPNDFNLGVIEVFPSPWNPSKGITVVSGTSDIGLGWAIDTFTNGDLIGGLDGDVTLIIGDTIEVLNSVNSTPYTLGLTLEEITQREVLVLDDPESDPQLLTDLPAEYRPQQSTPPLGIGVMYALIIAGVVLAVGGILRSIRKTDTPAD